MWLAEAARHNVIAVSLAMLQFSELRDRPDALSCAEYNGGNLL